MRYILSASPVDLKDIQGAPVLDENKKPARLTRNQFLLGRITDRMFGQDMDHVRSQKQIHDAITKAGDGVVALETADWERLRTATKTPSDPYHSQFSHNLLGFMELVENASDKPPEAAATPEQPSAN